MLKEFKEFALKGNVVDLAVGLVIGAAFGRIVSSLVDDVIMPPIGYLLGKVDFSSLFVSLTGQSYASLDEAKKAGAPVIGYGSLINTIVYFVIVAFAMFMVVRGMNRMKRAEAEAPPAPAETPAQEKLLAEIRDLLKQR